MGNNCFSSTFFRLTYRTSNSIVRVPKMSILKFSKRLPISAQVTLPLVMLLLMVIGARIPNLIHVLSCEHLMHNWTISSYVS
jgi:hypothetical protein